jgi:hypothetical protein
VDALRDLELLLRSRYPIVVVDSPEPERVEEVLREAAARLRWPFHRWSLTQGLRRDGGAAALYDSKDLEKALASVESLAPGLFWLEDAHRRLDEPAVVRRLLDVARAFERGAGALVLSAPSGPLPPEVERRSARFRLALPDVEEMRRVVYSTLRALSRGHDVEVTTDDAGARRIAQVLLGMTRFQAERAVAQAIVEDGRLDADDVGRVRAWKERLWRSEGVLEYVPLAESTFEPGGLSALKAWAKKRRAALSEEGRAFGLPPPKGVMLLGVQGCGKSLAARWLARAFDLPLLRLEPGRLFDKWLGESEKNLDRALSAAERMAPCVLWVDEIEKGFAAGDADVDAGVSQRVVGRFLGWLQERTAPVFVAATCNRAEALPPELMRKGRFDEVFFVDLPSPSERREILERHLRERGRDAAKVDLDAVVAATEGFSGAELEGAIVAALYSAFDRRGELDGATLLAEARATKPLSVLRREEVEALRAWARGRAVPAAG